MKAAAELADLAQQFEAARRHLRSVAFHLLGSVSDADDAVQSAWLKASRALVVVVDRLSPAQRVACVLHDVFAVPFETIAEVLNRSPDAAKKLASRARARVHPGIAARSPRTAEHVELVEAFLAASRGGDIHHLLELLAPEVVRRVDPALVPADVPTELHGAREVAEETRQFTHRARHGVVVLIDGLPGIVLAPSGYAETLLKITFGDDNRICAIGITGDADRVRHAVLAMPY